VDQLGRTRVDQLGRTQPAISSPPRWTSLAELQVDQIPRAVTIIAAESMSRRCFAMELAPAYVDVAVRRWEKATGQQARLDGAETTFLETAQQRGVVKEEMVKSILLRDKNDRYVMACVLGDARVDPKAVRAQLSPEWKRLSFANAQQIEAVTGCVQGAVTPLGLPDDVPVIFDQAIARCRKVNISSGDPMAGLELDPDDLIQVAGARLAPIAELPSKRSL